MQTLLLFAHADDETLGAGGLIQKLVAQGHSIQLRVVSDGIVGMRDTPDDNRQSLAAACKILQIADWRCLGFKDQQFETYPIAQLAHAVTKSIIPPNLIITHSSADLNQDHRIVHEVAKIIARPRARQVSIIAAEIPCVARWNHQAFHPQFYVDISDELATKLRAFSCYTDELKTFPDPYSLEGLKILAQFRAMESGYKAAEAFEIIRWFEGVLL